MVPLRCWRGRTICVSGVRAAGAPPPSCICVCSSPYIAFFFTSLPACDSSSSTANTRARFHCTNALRMQVLPALRGRRVIE